ncbi:MAG TPA: 30S ribosomal protein S4 [Planctomycetota bacterium]|nr:30S ribosomal protein S4 [Planctomycetota bacterium]
MGRYTGPKCRLCRREGMKLFLKGVRCESEKCAIARRDYPPGNVSVRRGKVSSYGEGLREKQKVKRFYGVFEEQFRRYFAIASRSKGNTGETLMTIFERRLDNVVFKLGWAMSRAEARQLITHGHINVNGKRVNVPSYSVEQNDEIKARGAATSQKRVKTRADETKGRQCPSWLALDQDSMGGKVVGMPTREDVSIPIQEQLIVELLSK